jgi:hypothetical protein
MGIELREKGGLVAMGLILILVGWLVIPTQNDPTYFFLAVKLVLLGGGIGSFIAAWKL